MRSFLKHVDDRVGYCEVKHCWKEEKNMEGVVIENGMVGIRKDYYHSGRVDKGIFVQNW